uniref:Uncharacterized protein n=1 Tax=Anguilla anguilla TaxID=7936 RepID=A0A0E9S123_ANGAN
MTKTPDSMIKLTLVFFCLFSSSFV